jgi:uncharacterized protein YecT (DUF1311 family)
MTTQQIKALVAKFKLRSTRFWIVGLLGAGLVVSAGLTNGATAGSALPKTAEAPKESPKPPTVPTKPDCQNPNTTIEINFCAGLAYKAADQLLNQTYQDLIATLKDPEKSALITAEQAWIPFRDANCKARVAPNLGGTGYSGFLSSCLTAITQARTTELKNWTQNR